MSQAGRSDKKRNEYGDGTWYMRYNGKYVYRCRYTDEYNKRATKSVSGNTEAECFEKAEAFLKTVKRLKGEFTLDATVPEILHWKIDRDYAKNYTTESTYDRNMFVISIIENSAIGDIPIAYMTPMHVDFFLRSITHYSNSMLRKVHSMLKTAFRIAFDCRLVDVNFMTRDDMRCPRSDRPDKKVRGFTESEQQRLINALLEHTVKVGSNTYKLQLLIEMYSGMRMGGINALKPEDIDFIDGFVHVRRTVGRGMNSRPYLKEGAKMNAGTVEMLDTKMKDIVPVLLTGMEDDEQDLKHELYSAPYKSIGAPHKI